MKAGAVAAIDLGATSGRVMLGHVGGGELRLTPIIRFPNSPVRTPDGLHWSILELYRNALTGIARAARQAPDLASVAVDSWGCDYALLRDGRMLGTPYHYRDERNAAAVESVHARVSPGELYEANGLQYLSSNTLYQLAADQDAYGLDGADAFLLVPDLINYWLSGRQFAEKTNASTTGLLSVTSQAWDDELIQRLGLPRVIFPELIEAGTSIGGFLPEVAANLGAGTGIGVSAVGSHDTASAVVAIPATAEDFAYISCGTWSLVGVELDHPLLTEAGRVANFTNEAGVDGRIRYLHNVMGLWLLSESVRFWERAGVPVELSSLLAQAAAVTSPTAVFDVNDPRFFAPGDMPARIVALCTEQQLPVPSTRAELVRSIIESLANAFARGVEEASSLSGKAVAVIHIVGGGSRNELLCQLTADRSGLPVLAGPGEATAVGNILLQARIHGLVTGDLQDLRALVTAASPGTAYQPQSTAATWRAPGYSISPCLGETRL